MRDGVIMYNCADPSTCPATTVQGLTGPHAVPAGDAARRARADQAMDPAGIGRQQPASWFRTSIHSRCPTTRSVGDGLNYEGFRFLVPTPIKENWYIARVDYKLNVQRHHTLFWRGALRNDNVAGVPYLPGQGPESDQVDYSKGFSFGYTAVVKSNLINNFRWGYTRQSVGSDRKPDAPVVFFRGLNNNSSHQQFELGGDSDHCVPGACPQLR